MENYSYTSYPESDSSPKSRENDFENPPPLEDNYKVKFMCSYSGKISPRPHDNQLSYVGGETKILAVERTVKFSGLVVKLSALCEADVCFKYQLPGEDLDALISVTNDDDLEHMMHEYDRLNRASTKPARLRLFLFPVCGSTPSFLTPVQSFGSNASEGRTEKDRFVEALNSVPVQSPLSMEMASATTNDNVDFLFGLEKTSPPPAVAKHELITDPAVHQPEAMVPVMYRRKAEENFGEYYGQQKTTEKVSPPTLAGQVPVSVGYWPEKQFHGGEYQPPTTMMSDQQVYMIQAPSNMMYHVPMARPVTRPVSQGYYAVQRMPTEIYRDQPVYNVSPQQQQTLPPKMTAYSDGISMIQSPSNAGVGITESGYTQLSYDRRQVYYTAQGAVIIQPQPAAAQFQAAMEASNTYNTAGNFNQDGVNVVPANDTKAAG